MCCKFGSERHRCCGEEPGTKGCKLYRACCQVVFLINIKHWYTSTQSWIMLVNNNIEYLQYRFWLQIEFKAGDEVQSGCLERYECCDGSFPNSKGCEDRYTCCESQIDSPGCLKVNKLSVYCIPGLLILGHVMKCSKFYKRLGLQKLWSRVGNKRWWLFWKEA